MPLCLSYREQHLICSGCRHLVARCPICRKSYCRQGARRPPRRHRAAEQVAQEVHELKDRLGK